MASYMYTGARERMRRRAIVTIVRANVAVLARERGALRARGGLAPGHRETVLPFSATLASFYFLLE